MASMTQTAVDRTVRQRQPHSFITWVYWLIYRNKTTYYCVLHFCIVLCSSAFCQLVWINWLLMQPFRCCI